MNYNNNDERNDYSDYGYRRPEATDRERDASYPQDGFDYGAPINTQGNAPISHTNEQDDVSAAPVSPSGNVPISTQNHTLGGSPINITPITPSGLPPDTPIAPGNRADIPIPDSSAQQQRMFAFRGYYSQGEQPVAPRGEDWREPTYSQAHETVSNMYTPGIYVNQPYSHNSHKRVDVAPQPERKNKEHSGFGVRFLRAVCLIILCVGLSGVAAYGVTENWFGLRSTQNKPVENSPAIINQVTLGSASTNNPRS
jgi:hypothetical protein